MIQALFYITFCIVVIWTLRYLPWINLDAAVNFQLWLRDVLHRLNQWAEDNERGEDE